MPTVRGLFLILAQGNGHYRAQIYYTDAQKAEMWDRWQRHPGSGL